MTIAPLLALLAALGPGDPRVGWRGDGSGNFPDAQPPLKWSASGEGILWKTPMPARSNSGPIVVDDRVFTCAEPSTLICASVRDGKILWSSPTTFFDGQPEDADAAAIIAEWKTAKSEAEKRILRRDMLRNDYFELPPVMGSHFGFHFEYTLPTPTSDGKGVYAVFGTGMVTAYELDGKRRWVRMLEKPTSSTGLAASPLLAGGRLLVNMGGFLHGLDPATGKTLWKAEQRERYGCPVRAKINDTELAVLTGGDVFRAADGQKLASGAGTHVYQSAVVEGSLIFSMRDDSFSSEDGSARMLAVKLAPTADGKLEAVKAWETNGKSGYSSPLSFGGLVYNTKNKIGISAIDVATGETVFTKRLDVGSAENYPCVARAGAYVFAPAQNGKVAVLKAGREGEVVAVNDLCAQGDQLIGPLFFVGKRVYARTHKFLVCVGGP